jgi:hypothetical protein
MKVQQQRYQIVRSVVLIIIARKELRMRECVKMETTNLLKVKEFVTLVHPVKYAMLGMILVQMQRFLRLEIVRDIITVLEEVVLQETYVIQELIQW